MGNVEVDGVAVDVADVEVDAADGVAVDVADVEVDAADGVAVDVADIEVDADGVAVDVDSLLGITITPRDHSSSRLSGRSIGVKNT